MSTIVTNATVEVEDSARCYPIQYIQVWHECLDAGVNMGYAVTEACIARDVKFTQVCEVTQAVLQHVKVSSHS